MNKKTYIVCQVTSGHRADDTRLYHKFALSFLEAGHSVTLIAPRALTLNVKTLVVNVIELPQVHSRWNRFILCPFRCLSAAMKVDADVYVLHDPDLLMIAWILKLRGARVIYDVHEDYPLQVLDKAWIPRWARPVGSWIMQLLHKVSFLFVETYLVTTPSIAASFSPRKTVLVRNFPILKETIPLRVATSFRYSFIYAGRISECRGIYTMLGLLSHTFKTRLCLAGWGASETLSALKDQPIFSRVDYCGYVSHQDLDVLYQQSAIGLVLLQPLLRYQEALPVKLFEYMASGMPVIVSDFPLWKEIVDGAGCGICVDPNDLSAIVAAAEFLLKNPDEAEKMGQRGREAVTKHYHWQGEKSRLIECLNFRPLLSDC